MRRQAGVIVLSVAVMLLGLAPAAWGGETGSYLDRFAQVSYSGNDGTLIWSGPWFEVGENDGPSAGAVQVRTGSLCESAQGPCLQVISELLTLKRVGAGRFADTSVFTSAVLSYHVGSSALGSGGLIGGLTDPLLGDATLRVEVTRNGGGTWTRIDSLELTGLLDQKQTKTHPIDDAYLAPGFGVRFLVDDLLGGTVYIDDVEVRGTLAEEGTTTTTAPTTTSTAPTTTSTAPTTTSTAPTTTTTTITSTATTEGGGGGGRDDRTTTTTTPTEGPATTVRTDPSTEDDSAVAPLAPGTPPGASGLRFTDSGVQAAYDSGRFGDGGRMRLQAVGLSADYRMVVEVIASSWVPLTGLLLLITAVLVFGFDRRHRPHPA